MEVAGKTTSVQCSLWYGIVSVDVVCSHGDGAAVDRGHDRLSRAGRSSPGGSSHGGAASDSTVTSDPATTTTSGSRDRDRDKKPVGLLITGFPARSSNSSVRDGLFHEYKKYGKVTAVHISGNGDDRHAVVSFKRSVCLAKINITSNDLTCSVAGSRSVSQWLYYTRVV